MRKTERIEVTEVKDKTITITCDGCGKLLDEYDAYEEKAAARPYGYRKQGSKEVKYFSVATSHGDWGNNSGDSYDSKYYCRECLEKTFKKYLEDCERSTTHEYEVEQQVGFVLTKNA